MNISALEELKQQLLADEVLPEKVGELIYASSSIKSWQEKEWQQNRDQLLKGCCEQCSSTKLPLVLQHTWHPKPYGKVKYEIVLKYSELIQEAYAVDRLVTEKEVYDYYCAMEKTEREVCSKCHSYNVKARKTKTPEYICGYCKHEMNRDELSKQIIPLFVDNRLEESPKGVRNSVTYSSIAWEIYKVKTKELLYKTYGKEIEKETMLIVIDESIRYQKCEDVVTFCKKCAFLYDVKKMDMCPICKTNYKWIVINRCSKCYTSSIK